MREADRRKDEFLALLSHELRNPLAPILTAAQLMQLRGDVATPHEREVILRQAQHLVRLVDDLLDVSRVARGKVTLTKRPARARERGGEGGRGDGAAARAAAPPAARCRSPRTGCRSRRTRCACTQVVSNLLTNAARYTPPGGRIEVIGGARGRRGRAARTRQRHRHRLRACCRSVFEMFVQGARGPDRAAGRPGPRACRWCER